MLIYATGLLFAFLATAAAQQPIEFPHDRHVLKAGLECIDCHSRVDTRAEAGIPSVRKCMLCHRNIASGMPGVKTLRQYAERQHEVPWTRVYGFETDAHVKFQHAPHIRARVACRECHGEVEKMTVARVAVNHTMGTCLTCHRQRNVTTDCAACHY